MPNDTEQHTDTPADLARYFTGPWCPKCDSFISEDVARFQPESGHSIQPGLHTRDPRTKVEGLECVTTDGEQNWYLNGRMISPAHAADLLVMGVVRKHPPVELRDFFRAVYVIMYEQKITLPQAVAMAMHRAKDAEGQG